MPITGSQDLWLTGARVIFKQDDVDSVEQPARDLGTIQSITPTVETETAECEDADGGVRKILARVVTKITETYDLELKNFSPENLSLLFLGKPPEDFTQTAVPQVDVDQPDGAILGHLYRVFDGPLSTDERVHNLTSVDAVKDSTGVTTFILNTDFEIFSLARGIIKILEGGAITPGDKLKLSFTPVAVSGLRLVKPQTSQTVEGNIEVYFGRENNANQTVRRARVSLVPTGTTFSVEEFSTFTLQATVLSEITESIPAGELLAIVGAIPAKS